MPPRAATAIILSGGGARAAYQVGALRAIAHILGPGSRMPFPVICGTSAGAINATLLAVNADDFRRGVARLTRWWRRITVSDIYHGDLTTLARHSARFLASVLTGGAGPAKVASMFDNAPLINLLTRELEFGKLEHQIVAGHLRALSINATSYTSGHAVTFFEGAKDIKPWQRLRRRGQPTRLATEHLMASTAIPFVFPAGRIDADFYMDGSVRQIAPLSPALHLGATRIVVLAVGQFAGQSAIRATANAPAQYPSFAQVAGHALSSVFLDNMGADIERLTQYNRLIDRLPAQVREINGYPVNHVDAFILSPSRDVASLALQFVANLPVAVRAVLRGFGSTQGTGANLTSYLLFDRGFCRALLDLGYEDAMARRDELEAFLAGDSVNFMPLPPHDPD
ncbi:MAG: patatin-like phospholipase family protein [Betaproteobacteria bacterium]